jgi:hypothetical protein
MISGKSNAIAPAFGSCDTAKVDPESLRLAGRRDHNTAGIEAHSTDIGNWSAIGALFSDRCQTGRLPS